MRNPEAPDSMPRRLKPIPGCLLSCVTLPVLLFAGLYIIYLRNNHTPTLIIPGHPVPAANGLDDFIKAGKLAQNMQRKFAISLPSANSALANPALASKDAAPALALMRQGLTKPCVNPPVRSIAASNQAPLFADIRELARVIHGEADYEAANGHPYQSAMTRLDGYEMAVMLPNGGNVVANLVGSACQSICVNGFEALLSRLSSSELDQIASRLDRIIAKRSSYADAILEDAYSMAAIGQEKTNDPENGSAGAFGGFGRVYNERMLKRTLDYAKSAAQEVRKPYTGKWNMPVNKSMFAFIYDSGGKMMYDVWVEGRVPYEAMVAMSQLLRTEVALYRFKAKQGRFPDQLARLTPTYLKSIPDDPFGGAAGRSLRYKALQNGKDFLLYSLGPNLKDDGGIPSRYPADKGIGDIVARKMFGRRKMVPKSGSGD